VLADTLAMYVDKIFEAPELYGGQQPPVPVDPRRDR
jgi:hypothetical protein